jgi:hypothetical protein
MIAILAALALSSPGHCAWQSSFREAIRKTEAMVWDSATNQMVMARGLRLLNVTWEDTGRAKGSSLGPNISDMTIGVRDPDGALHPMPVIRFDNFTDKSADLDSDSFWLRVGNEKGRSLHEISVAELLRHPRRYMHDPSSWSSNVQSLWASRDAHVLVSAQACFLPIPQSGEATFTPVLYNYQSYPGNPAVLAIVATREGTSMQVVENEGGYMSEALYFDQDGDRAPFTAERASDFFAGSGIDVDEADARAEGEGLNVVLLIQVPLVQKARRSFDDWGGLGFGGMEESAPAPSAGCAKSAPSDVAVAVVGHGDAEGPFAEMNGLAIERDPRFPVRVTVQFYKATSNGVADASDVAQIRHLIDRVYQQADFVGSLVTSGYTGRPTEWVDNPQPPVHTHHDDTWADDTWSWLKAR